MLLLLRLLLRRSSRMRLLMQLLPLLPLQGEALLAPLPRLL